MKQWLATLTFLFVLSPTLVVAQSAKKLSPEYRHWLEVEVPYIISTDERTEFIGLHSDQERDHFIAAFWQARNPDPNSELNTYKEEIYRRFAYANATFGSGGRNEDGWQTDMGRIYITLGAPQQRAPYHLTANIREMEIWFYQGTSPALPAYFYVVFYRRGPGEDFRLYSPRQDGPAEITSTGQRDPRAALSVVQKALGNEVARTLISLNPVEPVDLDRPVPSMESDLMLATIRNLADNPLEREKRSLRRAQESVTSSIFTSQPSSDLVSLVLRDRDGALTLNEFLRLGTPNARLIGQLPDKSSGYNMTLRTVLLTESGQPVYQQQQTLTGQVTQAQAAVAAKKAFGAEDRLPIVPGRYRIEATLTNNLNLEAVRLNQTVDVPEPKSAALGLSGLLVYGGSSPVRDGSHLLPFDFADLRFPPHALGTVSIHPGDRLPLVFQVWLPEAAKRAQTIHLHYLCGSVASAGKPPVEFDEDVPTSNADAVGNLVTGRTLDTSALPLGTYRLVLSASQSDSRVPPAYSTLAVRVVPPDSPVDVWSAFGPTSAIQVGTDELKRGLAAEAQGKQAEAERWYTSAVQANSTDGRAFLHLAALLARLGETQKLAALSEHALAQEAIDPSTAVLIAGALQQQGKGPRAIQFLDAQLKVQEPHASLYRALAELYDAAGNHSKAAEAQSRAKNMRP